jgi:outer membrane protein assembly factor BamB
MNDPNPTTAWFVFRVVLILSVMPAAIPLIAEQPSAHDQPWSQFRGFHHTGEAAKTATPPTKWNSDQFVWETDLPGTGWSSPVLDAGRVWLTTAIAQEATPEAIAEKLAGDPLAKLKTVAASVELRAICVDLELGAIVHNILVEQAT